MKEDNNDNNILIEAKNLKKLFATHGGSIGGKHGKALRALDGVSFTIRRGEIFGVVGESGCGKSTLGRCLLRLADLTEGSLSFDGIDITRKSRSEMKAYRRNMQMVFQNPFSSFNPKLKIGESLREVGKVYKLGKEDTGKRISKLLDCIGLAEDVLGRSPGELSGGQLQRLAIARALVLNPSFIVADEPVSALDVSVQAQILNLLVDLRKEFGLTMLFISHEMTVVEHLCDTVAVMYLGRIVELAPKAALFNDILHPYTQALMSAIPKADPEAESSRILLEGDISNAIDLPEGCRFAPRCRSCMDICKKKEPGLVDAGGGHFAACHLVGSK